MIVVAVTLAVAGLILGAINRPRTNASMTPAPTRLFDQDGGARRGVIVLTREQAKAIVGLLAQAKQSRLMNTQHADEAMAWLSPHPSMRPRDGAS